MLSLLILFIVAIIHISTCSSLAEAPKDVRREPKLSEEKAIESSEAETKISTESTTASTPRFRSFLDEASQSGMYLSHFFS